MSLSKRLKNQIEAHRESFEAPSTPIAHKAQVIGWAGNGYLINQGGDRRIRQSATNGAIGLGDVVAARDRIDAQRSSRSIQPRLIPIPSTKKGLIKVLFSVVEGSDRVFYIGGDRVTPKRIGTIPASRFVRTAKINSTGKGDRYIVGLQHEDGSAFPYGLASVMAKTITEQTSWDVVYTPYSEPFRQAYFNPYFVGHGFWTQLIPNFNTLGINAEFSSFSQYLGNVRLIAGGVSSVSGFDVSTSAQNAIAPNIDKPSSGQYTTGGGSSGYNVDLRRPLFLGKLATSAIYSHETENSRPGEGDFSQNTVLVNCETLAETTLGGDMGWLSDAARSLNLISSQAYLIDLPGTYLDPAQLSLVIPEDVWKITQGKELTIDVYDLSATTTKKSIKAKVLPIKQEGAIVHSLSYHP